MNNASINVGIVGATGVVGQELLKLLHDRSFPMASLRLFASARSAGKTIECSGKKYTVEEAKPGVFADLDLAFFAVETSTTKELAPHAVKAGCLVIDKSSGYRMDPDVPLVIPEINPEQLRSHKGIIANPNCSTAVALMALWPLHQAFGLKRYFAATYQSVSGTGADAVDELEQQIQSYARGETLSPAQMTWLRSEADPGLPPATADETIAIAQAGIDRALEQVRATEVATLQEPRGVGRAQLPTTVMGLVFHVAEHASRHAGQIATTRKFLRGAAS